MSAIQDSWNLEAGYSEFQFMRSLIKGAAARPSRWKIRLGGLPK